MLSSCAHMRSFVDSQILSKVAHEVVTTSVKYFQLHSHSCTCAQAKLRTCLVDVRILVETIQILIGNIYMIESDSLCEIVWVVGPFLVPQMLFVLKKYEQKYG